MGKSFWMIVLFMAGLAAKAQDPHFSQFFAAPMLINPASTGDVPDGTRISLNYRKQWSGLTSPFTTGVFSCDTKVFLNPQSENAIGLGVVAMTDQAMSGIYRSTYLSGNVAGHFLLSDGGSDAHFLNVGFTGMYGNRRIDYSRLDFASQFASGGFNTSLPSGEKAFSQLKPFFSMGAGIMYQYAADKTFLEMGLAGYHLNRPLQSSFQDPRQKIPVRYSVSGAMQQELSPIVTLNVNALYQRQSSTSYVAWGGAILYNLSNDDNNYTSLNMGMWYRTGDALYPYIGLTWQQMQVGFTYDITTSGLKTAPERLNSMELSVSYKFRKNYDHPMKCPRSLWR